MDKPKHWVKNVIKKCSPMAGFKVGLKQPSFFYILYFPLIVNNV